MFQENDVTQQSSQCVCTLRQRSTVQFTADVGWYDFDAGRASDDTSFSSISTNTLQYISIRALLESSVEVEGRFNELTFDNSSSTMRVSIHIKPVIFPGILGGEISLQCINPLSPLQTTTTTTNDNRYRQLTNNSSRRRCTNNYCPKFWRQNKHRDTPLVWRQPPMTDISLPQRHYHPACKKDIQEMGMKKSSTLNPKT